MYLDDINTEKSMIKLQLTVLLITLTMFGGAQAMSVSLDSPKQSLTDLEYNIHLLGDYEQIADDNRSKTLPVDMHSIALDDGDLIITCPEDITEIEGCDVNAITETSAAFPYSSGVAAITEADFVSAGGSIVAICNIISISYQDVIVDESCPGPIVTRTYTVVDDCGNEVTCNQTITVVDYTTPEITVPSVDLILECFSEDAVNSWLSMASANDECDGIVTLNSSYTTPTSECDQTLVVTFSATDKCGNEAITTKTFYVKDTIPPFFVEPLPIDMTVECDAVPIATSLTAVEPCGGNMPVIFSEVRADGDCPNNYTLTRIWTTEDVCGNVGSYSQTITVRDTSAPVFVETPPVDITVECGAIPTAEILTATDNCDTNISVSYSELRIDGECTNHYTLNRTWAASDECGNILTHTQVITVEDNSAPIITVPSVDLSLSCYDAFAIDNWASSAVALDNCSGVVSVEFNYSQPSDCGEPLTVTFTSTDACGNESTASKDISISDTTAPVILVPPSELTMTCYDASVVDNWIATASASDNCDSSVDLEYDFIAPTEDGSATIPVTFTAIDDCGNVSSQQKSFSVEDLIPPTLVCAIPEANYYADEEVGTYQVSGNVLDPIEVSDNCTFTVTNDYSNTSTLDGASFPVGETLVTWSASDGNNTVTCSYTITISDIVPPCIGCDDGVSCYSIGDQVVSAGAGADYYQHEGISWDVTASDNDGIASIFYELTGATTDTGTSLDGVAFNLGITHITWTVTDFSGNEMICSMTVTVNEASADLSVDKRVDNRYALPGQTITFTIAVENLGKSSTIGVIVTDVIPSGYSFLSSIGSIGLYDETTGVWGIGEMEVGAEEYLDIRVVVNETGEYLNTSVVSSDILDLDLSNNVSSAMVEEFCEMIIPQIFTPNGDGIQDYLNILCIERYPDALLNVCNRTGVNVYSKDHYGNTDYWGDDAWWDGSSNNKWTIGGEKLPSATYFYVLDLKDGSTPRTGYVFLNK